MKTEIFVLGDGRIVEVEVLESEPQRKDQTVMFDISGQDGDRLQAFAAAMRALVPEGGRSRLEQANAPRLLTDEVVAQARRRGLDAGANVYLTTPVPWQLSDTGATPGLTDGSMRFCDERDGPCTVSYGAWDILAGVVPLAILTGPRSATLDAATTAIATHEDMEDLLMRLCAPNHVVTGTAVHIDHHDVAPIERCASYHTDAATVARDLVLSWIFLYERSFVDPLAALPLSELTAHVENAPTGATVGVGPTWRHLLKYREFPDDPPRDNSEAWHPADRHRKVPRMRVPGDADLTREQVLAALATPPNKLLEALDACAVADAEWRAAEPLAREILRATKAGAPSEDVRVHLDEHTHWIEQHAPYHVRRLPNGGVMLATHPYRTLWPLWADALALLDIRQAT